MIPRTLFAPLLFALLLACAPGGNTTGNDNNANNSTNNGNNTTVNNTNNANNTTVNNTNNVNNTTVNNTNNVNNTTTTNNTNNTTPMVSFIAPGEGATVENPVTFVISAANVVQVQILAENAWPLSDPWDPAASTSLTYTFSGVDYVRELTLTGLDAGGNVIASDTLHITPVNPVPTGTGTFWHQMYNTYYYLARESDYSGADDTTLYDASCNPLAYVPAAFSDDVCIQGSGKLDDGTVVHYAGTCSCGRSCPTGGIVCYHTLDPVQYPWGMGSANNAIEPFRSWAVDNSIISFGTVLYSPDWDGVYIPSSGEGDGLGGFTHDGCFRADDVGGWIQNYHYDFNCGSRTMWQIMEGITPTYTDVDVHQGATKCSYLSN